MPAAFNFAERVADPKVAHDIRVIGDLTQIYCRGQHRDRTRVPLASRAAEMGIYRKDLQLCEECASHLAYAEERRAHCPKDPKPFCSHCDTHCYRPDEAAWERQMMRYSGARSMVRGHFIDGVKHLLEKRRSERGVRSNR